MSQATKARGRRCKECKGDFWYTALQLRDHTRTERLAKRLGITFPEPAIIIPKGIRRKDLTNERR